MATDIVVFVVKLLFAVVMIVSCYNLFTKAGLPGWLAFLPLANIFTFVSLAGLRQSWALLFFTPLLTYALIVSESFGWIIFVIPFVVLFPVLPPLVAYFVVGFSVGKTHGKNWRFSLGLVFLPFIFLPLLAKSTNKYIDSRILSRQKLIGSSLIIGSVATIYVLSYIALDFRGEYKLESNRDGNYGYWVWRSEYFWKESKPESISRSYGKFTELGVIYSPLSLTKQLFFNYYHITLLASGSQGDGYSISYPNLGLGSGVSSDRKIMARTSLGASWE